jgi:hypothetical protein
MDKPRASATRYFPESINKKKKKEDVINQQAGKTKQAKRVKKYKSRKNKPNSKTKKKQNKLK